LKNSHRLAESIHTFLEQAGNQQVVSDLRKFGVEYEKTKAAARGRLEGKVFVFTGALKGFTRAEAKRLVEDLGGRTASGISKKVDYVVVGDDPGSKLDDAKRVGVEIIDEKGFKKIIQG
jgi:DNA ligase (NAD+)